MTIRGLVLGKFLPPHRGHVHLFDFARAYCDEVAIVVERIPGEAIPSTVRVEWVRELAPGCRVIHLTDENPQDPADHPEFWTVWRESLRRCLPFDPDVVVASEPYGERLAAELNATFVPLDIPREVVPARAREIRADPGARPELLPPPVAAHYARRVRIVGPESTGKSTLARELARRLETVHVPEYAGKWIAARGGSFAEPDLVTFVRGQRADEAALARQARGVLICDTCPLTTLVWSRLLYERVAPEVEAAADAARYDLTLLCTPDLAYEDDVHRVAPETQGPFLALLEAELGRRGVTPVRIHGQGEARVECALAAIDDALGTGPQRTSAAS